jgi:diguanylate cyclase (GGDEF)-like protein
VPVFARVSPIINSLGEVIGALEVFSDNTSKVVAKQRIQELEELALICPLTGVGNRRYAEMALQNAFDELQRFAWEFGVCFVDLDHFKQVNDNYGHNVGDQVLRMTALALRNGLRSFDFVGRWGGEEFMVLLPNINAEVLNKIAERCRSLIEGSEFQVDGHPVQVTASMGAVIARPEETPESLIERADRLMYASKMRGRNCITFDS